MADPAFSSTTDDGLTVAILLCTYNGEQFLQAQLDSIAKQSHPNWLLFVSDDGSSDGTLHLIERFASEVGPDRVHLFSGPGQGFAKNFLSLLIRPQIDAPYIAFADQDDVWMPEKLESAIQLLLPHQEHPAMYAGPTIYIDEEGQQLGNSVIFLKPPSFSNALVQSVGGGNTMMLNDQAFRLIRQFLPSVAVVSHDWWIYLLLSAFDATVVYDRRPLVRYRQHASNLMGMNTSWHQKWRRIQQLWAGDFRRWNDQHVLALQGLHSQFRPSIQKTLDQFARARQTSIYNRLLGMHRAGVYRQTTLGNCGLWFAIVTGCI